MKYTISFFIILLIYSMNPEKGCSQSDTSEVRHLLESSDVAKSLEESAKIIEEAISLSEKIKFYKGKADALNKKGRVYLRMGEYQTALKAFWDELDLREKNPGWENSSISRVYAYIGESYRAIGSYELSEEYLNKSYQIAEKNKNETDVAYAYNRLASVYHEISYRRPDTAYSYKAIDFANKSLEIYKKLKSTGNIISNYNIIGAAKQFQGKYEESLKFLFLALEYAEKDTTFQDKPNIYNNIASLYNATKEYDRAIQYAKMSYDISQKSGIKVYLVQASRQLTTAYFSIGDYKNAFKYLEEASNLNSQLFDERKTSEIYGLQKKHEVERNIQKEKEKNTTIKIYGTALLTIILIIGISLYLRHRTLISINKKLELNNELISLQKEELAKSNSDKDKFFSILSHDIRNPLNGILGFTDILENEYDTIDDEEKKEFIGYLNTSTKSLYKLVDRVLLWSRLQRGNFIIKKEKINLKEFVYTAAGLQKTNAIKKGIILENNITEDIFIEADKNVLDTVLRNLIDNAVKFTETGGKVSIYSVLKEDSVEINISDTGVGIEKEDIEKLFGIENKTSTKGTGGEEGTGLGLTLCKDMLKLTGSNLKVESKAGSGSRFYFDMPIVQA